MAEPARKLGHYRIISTIDTSGMGEVYLAYDPVLARKIAVKVLPRHILDESDRLARFIHEIRAASVVDHPNVIRIYDVATEDGLPYMVMEHVEGRDLRRIIQEESPLPLSGILDIGHQIASALTALHENQLVHRDLKPENIIINDAGHLKILDFGLAQLAAVTSVRSVVGTPSYMSPEQIRGEFVDSRADQFALGIILYELATGRHPFKGDTIQELFTSILTAKPAPLHDLDDAAHQYFAALVVRLLEKDYNLRYPSTREVLERFYFISRLARPKESRGARKQAALLNHLMDELSANMSSLLTDAQDYRQELRQYEDWAKHFAHESPEEAAK